MALPLLAAMLAALTLAADAADAADAPGADQVQLSKTVCKTTIQSTYSYPMICSGSAGRLTDPDYCRCQGGKIEVKVPACHPDGSPVMGPRDAKSSYGDNNRLTACEDLGRHHQ